MSTLSQAPLIEVIFELRWGQVEQRGTEIDFKFTEADTRFFPGEFRRAAAQAGFVHHESVESPGIPFQVVDRYRRAPQKWPCLQAGLGVFTVNQINDGYDWEPFLEAVIEGLHVLDAGHPSRLEGLPRHGLELRVIDGLVFGEKADPLEFVKDRLQVTFSIPEGLKSSSAVGPSPSAVSFSYILPTRSPAGALVVQFHQGIINGQPGFVATTVVRAAGADCPEFTIDALRAWLQLAHGLQRESFKTLIKPAYMEKLG